MLSLVLAAALAAAPLPTEDGGSIVVAEDRAIELPARGTTTIPLSELVVGTETPAFYANDVEVTSGFCRAQAGPAWDAVVIVAGLAKPGDTCEVTYNPHDRATSSTPERPGVITVNVVEAASLLDPTPAADPTDEPTTEAVPEGDEAEPVEASTEAPAPVDESPVAPTAAGDPVTLAITLDRTASALGAGGAVLLLALIAAARRRARRGRVVASTGTTN